MKCISTIVLILLSSLLSPEGVSALEDNSALLTPNNNTVTIGGLFSVHANNDRGGCGRIRESPFVSAEAMIFAIRTLNRSPDILPNVTLTFDLRDTCGASNVALEETVRLLMDTESPTRGPSGLIGAAQSDVSITLASLLRIFEVPQISYASTATVLSDRERFDYFFRTIPPDNFQAGAMASLIVHFNWSYVIGLHSDDTYGRGGIGALAEELARYNSTEICLVPRAISPRASNTQYDNILQFLNQNWVRNATVIVFFGQQRKVIGLLDAIRRSETAFDHLTWIASDAWATTLPQQYHKQVRGLLGVIPQTHYVESFIEHYENLSLANRSDNPWFEEFWAFKFNCRFRREDSEPFEQPCEDLSEQKLQFNKSTSGNSAEYVIDAVYAFAHAIDSLINLECENASGLCDEILVDLFSHKVLNGTKLREHLYNVSFESPTSNKVFFDRTGDQHLAFYDIVNLGRNGIRTIGTWNNIDFLNITGDIQWRDAGGVPVSICSAPCGSGQQPVLVPERSDCCWTCESCQGANTVSTGENCTACPEGTSPNAKRDLCVANPITYLTWSNPWAIVILLVTALGLSVTIFIIVIFVLYNRHKIIKATSRELSAILLTGIALCYALPFVFIASPSPATCTVRRFGIGFSFALCFSPLLMKTNRIYRVFHQAPRTPRYAGPRSQVVFTCVLISVQVVIATVWLAVERPSVKFVYHARMTEKICGESPYVGLPVSLLYSLLLLVVTTFYAFLARKIPAKFNETKVIGITLYSICVVWLGFFPTYFATVRLGSVYQTSTLVLAVLISASTTLGCLFVPKVVLLFVELGRERRKKGVISRSSTTASIRISAEDLSGFEEGFRHFN